MVLVDMLNGVYLNNTTELYLSHGVMPRLARTLVAVIGAAVTSQVTLRLSSVMNYRLMGPDYIVVVTISVISSLWETRRLAVVLI